MSALTSFRLQVSLYVVNVKLKIDPRRTWRRSRGKYQLVDRLLTTLFHRGYHFWLKLLPPFFPRITVLRFTNVCPTCKIKLYSKLLKVEINGQMPSKLNENSGQNTFSAAIEPLSSLTRF